MTNGVPNTEVKVASLNLCLGLKNKKVDVEMILQNKNIDIICLQEVEVENNLDQSLLKIKNYQFELEKNSLKARTGVYINNEVRYKRMSHLEGVDSHILVIDLVSPGAIKRIINVYRSFNPQNNVNARD